jgi:response regulator NasT
MDGGKEGKSLEDRTLLVGSSEKSLALLQSLLADTSYSQCHTAADGAQARRMLAGGEYSLVVINTPLTDETGLDLAVQAAQSSLAGVILLVRAEMMEAVVPKVEESGVLAVAKPIARPLFDQALRLSMIARNRMLNLHHQNEKLQTKLEEMRMVDRAKCALIQYLRMTEQQAHRHIEKQAMDTRQTKMQVARDIVNTYEML